MMANLVSIHYYDANTGYAVSSLNKAIIKTTNGGQSWKLTAGATVSTQWVTKIPSSQIGGSSRGNNLSQHPFNRDAMFVAMDNDVFVSYNKGESWTDIANIPGSWPHSFYVSPLDTNVWVAAIANSSSGTTDQVIRSTDYGQTWSESIAKDFSNYGQPLEMDQNNPMNFYFAPDGGGFYRSTDMGATFTEISSNYPFRSPCDVIVDWDNSNVILVADGVTNSATPASIFRSTDNGVTWTEVVQIAPHASEVPAMSNSNFNRDYFIATTWSNTYIHISTDNGATWDTLYNTGASGWALDICREDPTLILTGSYGSTSFFSTNSGVSFNRVNISGSGAGQIAPERGYFLDMRTRAVWKMNITYDVITSVSEIIVSTNVPEKYNLYQNYPNPFNPSTKIKYDVPVQGSVKLTVFDQLGREVAQLVNGTKSAGSYLVEFDGSSLASGIYLYKLETRDNTITKKMTLIK